MDRFAAQFNAMADELVKEAANPMPLLRGGVEWAAQHATPLLTKGVKGLTAGGGAGRLVGGGVGTALGAGAGYATGRTPEERKQRALSGAMIGAVGGTLGGQLATQAGRGEVARFGQRQLHSMTGYLPRTEEQVAQGASRFGKGWTDEARLKALEGMKMKTEDIHGEAALKGLTHLPGVLKGLAKNPLDTLNVARKTMGTPMTVAMAGLPLMGVPGALKDETGRRGERVGKSLGEAVGFVAGAPVPIVGNIAVGSALGHVGQMLGRGADYLTGARQMAARQQAAAPISNVGQIAG